MSNLHIPAETWLREQFEFEYCECCGRDWDDHTAVPLLGNWFARCDKPEITEAERAERDAKEEGQ